MIFNWICEKNYKMGKSNTWWQIKESSLIFRMFYLSIDIQFSLELLVIL